MSRTPPLSHDREQKILARIQGGDRGALGELLGAYQDRVYHVCLRMLGNGDDAAEATQETLLRAIKHIDGFKRGSLFSTWLLRIAMNFSISQLRKGRLRTTTSLDNPWGSPGEGGGDGSLRDFVVATRELSPLAGVERGEEIGRLNAALDTLDPALRAVLLLRDLQGMDYQQVAEVLAVPVGTIKSRLFRARVALRQALEPVATAAVRSNGQPGHKPMR